MLCASIAVCQLMLAQLWVREAGFGADLDYAAIGHVLRRRAEGPLEGRSLEAVIEAYGPSLLRPLSDRGRWVLALNAKGAEPAWWPERLRWQRFRGDWLRVYEMAGRFVRGEEVGDPCPSAMHWGCSAARGCDEPRGAMVLHRCSARTRNRFYRIRR